MDVHVLGLGSRIAQVLYELHTIEPTLRVVAYADPDPAGLGLLRDHGIAVGTAWPEAEALVRAERPERVLIGSPNHCHLRHIELALGSGARIFCEKPVVISPEETWRVAELIASHGPERLLVGLVLRSAPLFARTLAAITSGRLGQVISIDANEILPPDHGAFLMRDWRRYRRYSGSHILEKCCHDLDLLQAMAGGRIRRVASFGGRRVFTADHADNDQLTDDAEARYRVWRVGWQAHDELWTSDADITDHQVAILEAETGVRIAFHTNSHGAWHQRRWLVCGHRGTVEADLATGAWRCQEAFGAADTLDAASREPHYGADAAQARHLLAAWRDGAPFPVTAHQALEAGLVAMAVDEAQRSGRVVDLTPWYQRLDAVTRVQKESP